MSYATREDDLLDRSRPQDKPGQPPNKNGSTGGPNRTATGGRHPNESSERVFDIPTKDCRLTPARVIAMIARLTREKALYPEETPTINAAIRKLTDLLDDRAEFHFG